MRVSATFAGQLVFHEYRMSAALSSDPAVARVEMEPNYFLIFFWLIGSQHLSSCNSVKSGAPERAFRSATRGAWIHLCNSRFAQWSGTAS